jgi:hypothetical protein
LLVELIQFQPAITQPVYALKISTKRITLV